MAGIGRGARFERGGASGGGGTTGNLRWGPNFGNNERSTFGAAVSISVAEFRQKVQHDLFVQAAIAMYGDISGLFALMVGTLLNIFFTLVFLYQLSVAASISMVALVQIGLMRVATLMSYEVTGIFGLFVAAALSIFFTLTFLYQTFVAVSIAMVAITEVGFTFVAAALTGFYGISAFNLFVASAIRMVALVLVGGLQVAARIGIAALQVGGLSAGTVAASINMTSLALGYATLSVATAIRLVALTLDGLVQTAVSIGIASVQVGAWSMGTVGVLLNISSAAVAYSLAVAQAVRMPALALNGLIQTAVSVNITSLQISAWSIGTVGTLLNISSAAVAFTPALGVGVAIKQPALALGGALLTTASIDLADLRELGLLQVATALSAIFLAEFTIDGGVANFTVPAGVTSVAVSSWGGGAGAGTAAVNAGGGGGGGAYAQTNPLTVTPGNTLKVTNAGTVAVAVNGVTSWVSTTTVAPTSTSEGSLAAGGTKGVNGSAGGAGTGGPGGTTAASIGTTTRKGGNGANGTGATAGGGGGGGAGSVNPGGDAPAAPNPGTGGTNGGGNGGQGANASQASTAGLVNGGGGGGAIVGKAGSGGAAGKNRIAWSV